MPQSTYGRCRPSARPYRDHRFSHGGTTALYTALASGAPTDRGGRPFQAVVAYYPGCLLKVRGEPEKILGERQAMC